MSDFQDNAPVQLKPIKACAQIIAERDRYREALAQVMHRHERTDEVTEMICKRALYPETFPSE